MGAASVKDVAMLAGVSPSTVSNYLNRRHVLSKTTRHRVQQAIEELDFVPNESARQLRAGASKALGLILLDAWLPFFSEMSRGVEDAVRAQGWSLFFSNSERDPRRELANLDMYESHRVQGVIISPQGKIEKRLQHLQKQGIECVTISPTESSESVSSVGFDNVRAGELVGRHLVETVGRKRLAFLGDPHNVVHSADRLAGLTKGAQESAPGVSVMTVTVRHLTVEDGMEAARQIVVLPDFERPDAVFAANDMVAMGALTIFLRAGIRVPDDIAIAGHDDVDYAHQAVIPLTTVRQPGWKMGHAAGRRLLKQIHDDSPAREVGHEIFEPELIVRASTVGDLTRKCGEVKGRGGVVRRSWRG